MLERAVYEILDQGREFVNENPDFIVSYFCGQGLSRSEAESIRDYWNRQDKFYRRNLDNTDTESVVGVNIIHSYPRNDGGPKFPCWAIVLLGENEHDNKGRFIGDEGDDAVDPLTGQLVDMSVSVERKQFGIFTYADNPDVCLYYYHLAKFFVKRARGVLKSPEYNVLDSALSGADMAPDPRYEPEYMFVRRLTLEMLIPDEVISASQSERGSRLGGAFVRNPEGLDVLTTDAGETIFPAVTPIGGTDE